MGGWVAVGCAALAVAVLVSVWQMIPTRKQYSYTMSDETMRRIIERKGSVTK